MSTSVLVTDGEQRAALAIVRSLGAAGYRCVVASSSGRSLAGISRFAARDARVPDPGRAPEEYAETIEELTRTEAADLLIPVTESSLLAVLPMRDRLAATVPFPSVETFRAICDKEVVLGEAAKLGIRVPGQAIVDSPEAATDLDMRLPAVLKPARSVYTNPDGSRAQVGVRWARSQAALQEALAAYPAEAYPILVQETIEGPGIGIFVLLHRGELLARFSHRRIREKPPSGGVSVVRQSEPMDTALLERSLDLLARFDWEGVAMVEYKRDDRTGEDVLMEINGRFWGSLQLAIDAGVDFPRLLAEATFDRRPGPVETYGKARLRWFWGDVDHLLAVWKDGWPLHERFRSTGGFFTALGPRTRCEVFRWSDPRPFILESRNWFSDVLRR